jgi:hypothetical protein
MDLPEVIVTNPEKSNDREKETVFTFPSSPFRAGLAAPPLASQCGALLEVPGPPCARQPPPSPFLGPAARWVALGQAGAEEEARTPLFAEDAAAPDLETTEQGRSQYRAAILAVFTDGLLPLVSLVLSGYNTAELFFIDRALGGVGLALFCFPSLLVLLYYAENLLHRERAMLEAGLILALGPLLRWLASAHLLLLRLGGGQLPPGHQDLIGFATATRIIDGVFQGSVQIVWLLYLIATEVRAATPPPGCPGVPVPAAGAPHHHRDRLVRQQPPAAHPLQLRPLLLAPRPRQEPLPGEGQLVQPAVTPQLWRLYYPSCTAEDGSATVPVLQEVGMH